MDDDLYLEERNRLDSSLQSQYDMFDKNILLLSGGSFGISLTFFNSINGEIKMLFFLIFSWAFFCLSILSTLISFLSSQFYHQKLIKRLDAEYEGQKLKPLRNNSIDWINIFSMISFFIGVICLVIFTSLNIGGGEISAQ